MNKPQTSTNVKPESGESPVLVGKVILKDVAEIRSGYSFRSALEEMEEGVPVVQIRDLTDSGRVDPASVIRVPDEGFKDRHFAKPGEVLFAARGAQRSAAVVEGALGEMVAGSQFLVLTVKEPDRVSPEFLAWLLGTESVRRQLDAKAAGATIPHVSIAMLSQVKVDIPSVAAQDRLLEMREAADREVNLLQNLIAETRVRNEAVLAEFLKSQVESETHENI
jgi:restriction endonuclease S subunit